MLFRSRDLAIRASGVAADLEAIASAAEGLNLSGPRSQTEAAKAESAREVAALKEALTNLTDPASALNDEVSQANSRLAELGQQAAVLIRKARESSAKAGLAFVEEAAGIKAEARTLAKRTALNQIEADTLSGEAAVVGGALHAAEGMQAAASSALTLINSMKSDIDGEAAKARDAAKADRKSTRLNSSHT